MKEFTARYEAIFAAMMDKKIIVDPRGQMRRGADTILTQQAMLEMQDGEAFVLCYPGGSVLFECKGHYEAKKKNVEIVYDELSRR